MKNLKDAITKGIEAGTKISKEFIEKMPMDAKNKEPDQNKRVEIVQAPSIHTTSIFRI